MGSTDRLYARAHPFRWAGFFWPHWLLALALVGNGMALRGPIFAVVVGHQVWPAGMFVVAALIAVSAVRPFSQVVQATTAAALFSVSVFRILAYLQLVVSGAVPPQYFALVGALISHWIIAGIIAVLWPRVSEMRALKATNAAGAERSTDGVG